MIRSERQQSAYFPLKINNSKKELDSVVPIRFPSTRNILWQSKPVGDFETLSLRLNNKTIQLFVVEKSLRLAHRYSEDRNISSFLLGSVYPKSGDGGICFEVDRFDPGREISEKIGEQLIKSKIPTAVVPGDHIIPIIVKQEVVKSSDSQSHTKDEFSRAVKVMQDKICGKDALTLSHIVSLKANLYCHRKYDELIVSLHCGAVVPDITFHARPIAPLPIIPTTLARNLSGPLRLSDVEGTPKMGYVTMDETRKLLLLLESDLKAYSLPLIGIWISGVNNIHHPYVWASCLRYLNCSDIKDRVLSPSRTFLFLHYSIARKIPDFWECHTENDEFLEFELLSCRENLHLDLDDVSSKDPVCFHLTPTSDSMNKALFNEAIFEWKKEKTSTTTTSIDEVVNNTTSGHTKIDGQYSPSPRPSPTQLKTPCAPAPEESLSLSFDEGSNNTTQKILNKTVKERKVLTVSSKQPQNPSNSCKISREPFRPIANEKGSRTVVDKGNQVVSRRTVTCCKKIKRFIP